MNPSLTVKIKIYYFPNIITAHVIIDIFYVSLQNDVVRHCLFWFHMLHSCGLFIHFIFTTSCLHIHHMCGVCICSVCKQSSVVVKSKHVLFVLCRIYLFLHFTPDPEKTVSSVCLCVSLSIVWMTASFSFGKYRRNPSLQCHWSVSTKLVKPYSWVQGVTFFSNSSRLHNQLVTHFNNKHLYL